MRPAISRGNRPLGGQLLANAPSIFVLRRKTIAPGNSPDRLLTPESTLSTVFRRSRVFQPVLRVVQNLSVLPHRLLGLRDCHESARPVVC